MTESIKKKTIITEPVQPKKPPLPLPQDPRRRLVEPRPAGTPLPPAPQPQKPVLKEQRR